ncbi:MAG: PQQ-binding-like beta-propeller repeat protein, partial [Pirellulales bacterium]
APADGRGRVAVASSERELVCLDGNGKTLWHRPIRGPAASSISVGDIDLDGRADLLVVTQLGVIYRFDEEGRIVWQIDMQGRSLAAGAIIDINGDGRLEYAICTQRGRLLVLDEMGRFLFDRQFDTRTVNVTPTFGDMEPQSAGLEMVLTGGESGKVFCLATRATAAGPAQWTAYRGDARKSGSWFGLRQTAAAGMTPRNLAWDKLLAGDAVRFRVENPQGSPAPLTATAICVRPDGQRQVATSRVLGTHGELRMSIEFVVPGTYRFTWSLKDANGQKLAVGARQVVVRPFANDRALARRAADDLKATAAAAESTLPRSAAALRHEAMLIETEINALMPRHDSAPGSDVATQREIVAKTAALVARAKRALALARTVRGAAELGPGTSLIAFEGTVWENRDVDRQLPKQVENPLKISRRAVPGEHEPIVLSLLNVTDDELQVRVHIDVDDTGPKVVAHRSVCVPTSVGTRSWDPLPELGEASLLSIPSMASRELWLDVETGTAAPGEHPITVRLQAIDGAGVLDGPKTPRSVPPPETSVAIRLRLLPLTMAPPGVIRLCTWAAPEGPQVEDLLAHGNNVFTTKHPTPQFDGEGRLTRCDYTGLDQVISRFRGHDVVLLLQGIPALRSKFDTAPYRTELAAYLNDLVAHMASMGVDMEHFSLYPLDEPGGYGWDAVNKFVAFGKMVRAVNPDIMIYMDGGGELPMFQAMAPYVDIWCPAITMLPEQTAVMEVARTTGKMLWSYDCVYAYARPVGPNIKNVNIIGQFRTAALFALRHGATGIGYWCYNIGGDPWTRIKDEYPLVYPGRTRPVTSRRWEAVREGIEDYRILVALRDRLRAGASPPLDPAVQARIRHLLVDGLAALLDQSFAEVNLGLGQTAIDATNSARSLNAFRTELLDCVEAVAGTPDQPGTPRQ